MERTDLPGKRWIEPLILVPSFVSPMVLAFGYVVAAGPGRLLHGVGAAISSAARRGASTRSSAMAVIAGLTHVPNVYVYASSALKSLGSDVEEAARIAGASPFRVAATVSLPLIMPALLFAAVLVFFLGFELFGLPLVLGDPEGHLVLSTYLYKLTNKLGTPSYHLMAAVAICIVAVTFPLVLLQRHLLQNARKLRDDQGQGRAHARAAARPLEVGRAPALLGAWLFVARDRAAVRHRAARVRHQLGLSACTSPRCSRSTTSARCSTSRRTCARSVNTILIGTVGGAIAVACYTAIGFATHRRNDGWSRFVDYLVLVPRAVPGLLAGLAFLWVFLFFPPLHAAAHDDLQHVARLHRGLARLRDAAHLVVAAAGVAPSSRKRRAPSAPRADASRARSRCR